MPVIDLQGNSLVQVDVGKSPKLIQAVSNVEPIRGYWSGNSNWGQGYKGVFPTTEGALIQLGRVPDMPGPPRVRAVILGRRNAYTSVPGGGMNSAIRAKIIYGIGGVTNQFYCDWVNGTAVAVVATSLQVVAESYRPEESNPTYLATGQPPLDISAGLGCEAAAQGNATYTLSYNQGAGATQIVNIPQFANRVSIRTTQAAAGTAVLSFFTSFQSLDMSQTEIKALNGAFVPIPGNTQVILLSTALTTCNWTLTFGLAV